MHILINNPNAALRALSARSARRFLPFLFSVALSGAVCLAPALHRVVRASVKSSLRQKASIVSSSASVGSSVGSWQRQKSQSLAWLHSIYFIDSQQGWAAGGRGSLLRTIDGGETWRAERRPVEDDLLDVYFADAETGWLLCERAIYNQKSDEDARSYLLHTTDGGKKWTRVDVGDEITAAARLIRMLFIDANNGWVFGETGILFRTRDAGETWQQEQITTRNLLLGGASLDKQETHAWLVGAGGAVLRTTDGGGTWREIFLRDEDEARSARTQAAGEQSVSSSAVASRNPDAPNTKALIAPRLYSVSFVDARRGWAVGGRGAIWTTTNGGGTWRRQPSGTESDLLDVKFINANQGWAVGTNGTIIYTSDGGVHWQEQPSNTRHRLERIAAIHGTRVWVVGFGGTILIYEPQADSSQPQLKRRL